ncbi:hypothetical protein [Melittangium boletus]|nr:hypothetical protein [Melittangium boletus]
MLAMCLVVSACGSTSPSPAEPTESGERTGLGPGDDPAGGGTVSGLEGEPSLPPRACIPWTRPTPPVRATACASFSVFADGSSVRARYDADSRPLEVREFSSDGTLHTVETRVWSEGLERLYRREELAFGLSTQSEWTYDGRRLLRRVDSFSHDPPKTYDYVYDAQGRITRVVRQWSGESVTSLYTYDVQGRLVRIADEQSDWLCGSGDSRCASLSYWPNGVLKRHEWETGKMNFEEEFDAAGRLVGSLAQDPDHLRRRQLGYDEAGRLRREWRLHSWYVWDATSVTRTVYDPAGRRERFAEELADYGECGARLPDCEPERSSVHVTRRTTFFCGTEIVALDEWDGDEDGVVDATRTHERDDAGRLVHEVYSGTPGLDDGPVLRDFTYECAPSGVAQTQGDAGGEARARAAQVR